MRNNILYISLVLDDYSRTILVNFANRVKNKLRVESSKLYCHHMTVAFGSQIDDDVIDFVEGHEGEEYKLRVIAYGMNKKACAIKVETNCPSKNKQKHVTLFTINDGKPKDSNEITNWTDISEYNVELKGILTINYK